jgi:hypothetical protein
VLWAVVAVLAVAVGFLVGRFTLPLVLVAAFLAWGAIQHPSHDDDLNGIVAFGIGVFAIGGTTIGTIARYVTRWIRRSHG